MNTSPSKPAAGANSAKVVLAIVLGLMLAGVLAYQWKAARQSEHRSIPLAKLTAPDDAGGPAVARAGVHNDGQPEAPRPAPAAKAAVRVPMEEIVSHDPFALPGSLRPKASADPSGDGTTDAAKSPLSEADAQAAAALATLQQQGVQMVVMADGGKVAVVGDRRIRVGDRVEGLLVRQIGPEGIVLAREKKKSK